MQTNERTIIRTIVRWSKSAAILATVAVLLAAFVFVKTAHANSINEAQRAIVKSQQEASEIKSQLETVSSEKEKLNTEVQVKEEKINQLEKENSELKG
jgi:peptidoglycan hydrolase CwlO-like protein